MVKVLRGAMYVVVIGALFLAIVSVLYFTLAGYLQPYTNELIALTEVKHNHPLVNNVTVLMFITSPFNANEARILGHNPLPYLLLTVTLPTLLIMGYLIVYVVGLGRGQLARVIKLELYVLLVSLANSWLTSVIMWLIVGLPSIGTSVIIETLLIAFIYTAYVTLRHMPKSKLITLAVALFAVSYAVAFITIIPLTRIPHAVGLVLAITLLCLPCRIRMLDYCIV
ncbi:hypothetical protein [Caldivirga sp.]|uniref:hypothetical protein n=1 Tax=Caldivirga sp. TaxID=2080243 RepID=UPI003D134660